MKMKMHNPPHPGEIIKELYLEPLGLTITEAAAALDVSRKTLSAIINGRAGISPEMAIRLSVAFDTTEDRKSTRLNSSHVAISYAVFCLKKKHKELVKRAGSDDSVHARLGYVEVPISA